MQRQDEFTALIEKFNLWDDEVFMAALPEEADQKELYENMLNECQNDCFKVPAHWNTSYAKELKENDPAAYRCGFADFTDSMREDYFERAAIEEFYPEEGIRDAINEALQDRADCITEQIIS